MVDVFISYKSERRAAAEHLAKTLRHHGFTVWFDYELVKGRDFGLQIDAKVRLAKAVVVLWCSLSVKSRWVHEEVDLAQELGTLTPVKIEACDLPVGNRRVDYVDLSGWDGSPRSPALDDLLETIGQRVGRAPVPDFTALKAYEADWRRFGAPPLRAFALARPLEMQAAGAGGVVADRALDPTPPGVRAAPAPTASPSLQDLRETWEKLSPTGNLDRIRRFHADHAKGTLLAFEVEHRIEEIEADLARKAEAARLAAEAARREAEAKALREAEAQRRRVPGAEFREGEGLPLMVTLPPGPFKMGSPQREVRIGYPLAVGKHPVLVGEWRAFVAATGHDTGTSAYIFNGKEWKDTPGKGWRDPGFAQDDRHPVTCVSWDDARAYAAWLSKQTGHPYRLLSEAEWEYACRAGTTTRYAFGDEISTAQANFNRERGGTTPAGQYGANRFGLHDMHGNVWEWVADCYRDTLEGLPQNGEAFETASCSDRVIRGGSWDGIPQGLRSALRDWDEPSDRSGNVGFRLARTVFMP